MTRSFIFTGLGLNDRRLRQLSYWPPVQILTMLNVQQYSVSFGRVVALESPIMNLR